MVAGQTGAHPYQDPALPVSERVADLLGRMTLVEKIGQMFHAMVWMGEGGALAEDPQRASREMTARELIGGKQMTHLCLLGSGPARQIAGWHNRIQELAAGTRLGIPVTLSTDPRHSFTENPGTGALAGAFSEWPEPVGLAALRDPDLVRRFADTVRREYVAVGLRLALHPQLDLATEPRWSRSAGTFGEDAQLAARLGVAYVEGLRGGGELGPDSVSAMVKHVPGGGPQKDGEDPHFPHGKEQVYPGGRFDYHLEPFRAAIDAGVTQVMPYYGVPVGTGYEEVAFGFNGSVITGLLRDQLGFDGIVCTDFAIITDHHIMGEPHQARAWGVEQLTPAERLLAALAAGVDQFGGESCPELLVPLVRSGMIPESRIDHSVGRLLAEKFRLGLFDERRYVDPDLAEATVGGAGFVEQGAEAQRCSVTLLKNRGDLLPLTGRPKLYVEGADPAVGARYAEIVTDPAAADLAVLRLTAPYEHRPGRFESFFHSGRLDFPAQRLAEILGLLWAVPTIVVIHLERPAVIPEIAEHAAALLGVYGTNDEALFDVLLGRAEPRGRLPFPLPRSMAEVERGHPDTPSDSPDPLYPFGYGLRYRGWGASRS